MDPPEIGAPPLQALRVLHVSPYYEDAWAYGGIPRVVAGLTRGLARRGHDVTVCTTDACDATTRLSMARASEHRGHRAARSSGEPCVVIFPNVSNRLAYSWQAFAPIGLARYLRGHAALFDIAHLHACRNVPGAIAARALRRAGVPYVLAPNGTAPRIERRRRLKRCYDAVIGRHVMRGAARVLAVSHAERGDLRSLGVSDERLVVVPNPIDLTELADLPPRGEFRAHQGLEPGPLVLYLGRLSPRKRVESIVDAFARLGDPRATLMIAGDDMGARSSVVARVRALELTRQTLFTGLLTGRDRLAALVDADVVVYTGEREVFGLVAVESLACGTPVVVADDSGCAEIVHDAGGGVLVPPGDAGAIAQAMRTVLAAPEWWRHAAGEAALRVRARYDTDAICRSLETAYLAILDDVRRHAVA